MLRSWAKIQTQYFVKVSCCLHYFMIIQQSQKMSLGILFKYSLSSFHRWWQRWLWPLSSRHLRWRVWLWWWSYTIFGIGRGPSIPPTLWRRLLTPAPLVVPASKHLFAPRRFDHSPGLWIARVSSPRRRSGHLEPQEGECRGTLWTIRGRTQALSPRSQSRLGGENIITLDYFSNHRVTVPVGIN